MLWIHPVVQLAATLLAFYVLLLGAVRFRQLHLQQKSVFKWQRHVWLGTVALLLWLAGLVIGLVMVQQRWHGILLTGNHGNRLFVILPLILFSLLSGWYLHKRKKRRVVLPLIHGSTNVLLIILASLQVLSGWQVLKVFTLGP